MIIREDERQHSISVVRDTLREVCEDSDGWSIPASHEQDAMARFRQRHPALVHRLPVYGERTGQDLGTCDTKRYTQFHFDDRDARLERARAATEEHEVRAMQFAPHGVEFTGEVVAPGSAVPDGPDPMAGVDPKRAAWAKLVAAYPLVQESGVSAERIALDDLTDQERTKLGRLLEFRRSRPASSELITEDLNGTGLPSFFSGPEECTSRCTRGAVIYERESLLYSSRSPADIACLNAQCFQAKLEDGAARFEAKEARAESHRDAARRKWRDSVLPLFEAREDLAKAVIRALYQPKYTGITDPLPMSYKQRHSGRVTYYGHAQRRLAAALGVDEVSIEEEVAVREARYLVPRESANGFAADPEDPAEAAAELMGMILEEAQSQRP